LRPKIPYASPSITDLEVSYATDAAANGWGDECYAYIDRFEELFRKHLGVEKAIATSSCTGALHMGMSALGIGPGDEVILADSNWIATASPIVQLGAKPIFVDILEDSWCIDPTLAKAAITPRTKAIIATHLYGNLCEMDELLKIGRDYDIAIIEDSAEAIGSVYHGRKAGSMGTFGAFSFHGTKTISTGEGGMFVTNNHALYEKVLTLSNHGRSKKQTKQFWPDIVGFKFKMSNIQAAIGCAQVERIIDLISRKRDIFTAYYENLSDIPCINMNPEPKGTINGFWMPTVIFSEETHINLTNLLGAFAKENIDARIFFWPLSSLPMFKSKTKNKISKVIAKRAINLPSFHDIELQQQNIISNIIKKILNRKK
jgi:perosamine synthetase